MPSLPPLDAVEDATLRACLRVGGLVPFSTSDWPDRLAAVVFLQGCPWRCGYCHNPHLREARSEHEQSWPATLEWLATRRGLLDGIVFSGGEPLAQAALPAGVRDARALGFDVGLHTGGSHPRRLHEIIGELGWVGLDIKAPRDDYEQLTGVPRSGVAAFESLALLLRSEVPCEVRTTVHPALTPLPLLEALATELAEAGVDRWVLQRFRPQGCADAALGMGAWTGVDDGLGSGVLATLASHVPDLVLR